MFGEAEYPVTESFQKVEHLYDIIHLIEGWPEPSFGGALTSQLDLETRQFNRFTLKYEALYKYSYESRSALILNNGSQNLHCNIYLYI
jgi:hypothetical protein